MTTPQLPGSYEPPAQQQSIQPFQPSSRGQAFTEGVTGSPGLLAAQAQYSRETPRSIEPISVYNQAVVSGNGAAPGPTGAGRLLAGSTQVGTTGNGMSASTLASKQQRYQTGFTTQPV